MRAIEFIKEQGTIGTIGTTTATPQPVSQTSTSPTTSPDKEKQDPNVQKLAATLKQNRIIDTEQDINNFLGAYQAQSTGKSLNPDQQASMAKLAGALMKNRNLSTNIDLQLKTMSQQKPGQSPGTSPTTPGVK